MFDTMKVAKKIKEARIAQNMTQMNLADIMEVSYQAVSNWERGNSMPDISKLEQLCQVLHLSMDELLGADVNKTLTKIVYKETSPEADTKPVAMEDIREIAPILPPDDVEKLVDDNFRRQENKKISLSALTGLAPFLDDAYLDELIMNSDLESDLSGIVALAPFLSEKTLDKLVAGCRQENDFSSILSLAPFLSDETLNKLALEQLQGSSLKNLTSLAPYLSNQTLDKLVMSCDLETGFSTIASLAPFLSNETLQWLADTLSAKGHDISGLYPFLSQSALRKIAKRLMQGNDMDALKSVVPFL